MTDQILVLTTVANDEDARRIAEELVGRRLAACVNITAPVHSIYRWEGRVQHDDERLLLVKTLGKNFDRVRECITQIHPYELPELVALDLVAGEVNYFNWITAQSTPDASSPE